MRVDAFFPNSLWNGYSKSRNNQDPILYNKTPTNQDWDQIVAEIMAIENYLLNISPPINPNFTSFSIQGQSNPVEIGTVISAGDKSFIWTTNFPDQVTNIEIDDTTNNLILGTDISNSGSIILTLPNPINSDNIWTIFGNNKTFSKTYLLSFLPKIYWGSSNSSDTPDITFFNSSLRSQSPGVYSFSGSGYYYLCVPDSFSNINSFTINGFNASLAQINDDSNFLNVENGFYYQLIPITNQYDITLNYRIYRTRYILNQPINLQVS